MSRRLKILYINNYACDISFCQQVRDFTFLSNHLWGVYQILEQGHQVDFISSHDAPSIQGKKNPINRLIYSIKKKLYKRNTLRKYKEYDVIYSAITGSVQMDYFARLKKKELIQCKLISVLHHPVNKLKYAEAYDKVLFLSQEVEAKFSFANKESLFWGPDLSYYDHWINTLQPKNQDSDLTFISNGKTLRDHNEFLFAASQIDAKAIILCDKTTLPDEKYLDIDRFTILYPHKGRKPLSNIENTEIVLNSDVMIIPVVKDNAHLCGLTSFVDGIALGKPIIMSDNTFIGIDIEKEGFGFIYRAGDAKHLEEQMKKFIDNRELVSTMGMKAKEFAQKHNFKDVWAKRLIEIMQEK